MNTPDLERILQTDPLITRREVEAQGITRTDLRRALSRDLIFKLRDGVYCRKDLEHYGNVLEFAVVCKITDGVIWEASAGQWHDLTDDIPKSITVLANVNKSATLDFGHLDVDMTRTRVAKAMTVGVEDVEVEGLRFRITNPARTVVDLLRTQDVKQHSVEAIRAYCADHSKMGELHKIAEEFGIRERVTDMTAAILAAFDRTPMR